MRYSFSISDVQYKSLNLGNVSFEVEMSSEEVRDQLDMLKGLIQDLPQMVESFKAAAAVQPAQPKQETHLWQ